MFARGSLRLLRPLTRRVSSAPNPPAPKRRFGLVSRTFFTASGLGLAAYTYDTVLGAGITNRTVRSLSTLIVMSVDYKRNFEEGKDIEALHERNAQRLYDLLIANKGLYIKMGQMIALQGMVFPIQYQQKFSQLFDKAPRDDWDTCDKVLKEELGADYRERLFESFDKTPVASASVAQVHKAKLLTGEEVAVKIQHEAVTKQMWVDLATYRFVMKVCEWVFDMPLTPTVRYVTKKMTEEVNFEIEKRNGELISSYIQKDPEFRKNVYIPKYFPEASSKRVLSAEWINADTIGDYLALGDKGYNIKKLMNNIIKVYSRQVFQWGLVHCDLHPGNLMVRFLPDKTQQLVILDHGLYEYFGDEFRRQYAQFWRYSFEWDMNKLQQVLVEWGIDLSQISDGLNMMDPKQREEMRGRMREMRKLSYFERQRLMSEKTRQFFKNSDKFPMTLLFIMRSMRIVQGLNKRFGSPCNRVDMLATEAIKTVELFNLDDDKFQSALRRYLTYTIFRITYFVRFHYNKLHKQVSKWFNGKPVRDLEEEYERQAVDASKGMGLDAGSLRLELADRLRLAYSCRLLYKTVIPQVYSHILYLDNKTVCDKNFDVELVSDRYTLVGPAGLRGLLQTLSMTSCMNFKYADMVLELFLEDAQSQSDQLVQWRATNPVFPNLVDYRFPATVDLSPLSFLEAPNLETLVVDVNFCNEVERNQGLVSFVNLVHLRTLVFAGKLARNEDMVIYRLLTSYPHSIKRLSELRFECNGESGDRVYRRVVGVMAILRKIGMLLNNLSKIALPLTNHSTPVILNLISKHVHLEHLSSLELFIEDDGGVLNLLTTVQHLASMLRPKSGNIRELSVHYKLTKPDIDKNHLRSMMLLKFMESFKHLHKVSIDLEVEGLDLSNLLMIVGTPLSGNTRSLRDIRLNINTPSENLVANLLNSADDLHDLFPNLNYMNNCPCDKCATIYKQLESLPSEIRQEAVRVSTMMVIGNELDRSQLQSDPIRSRRRFLRTQTAPLGYLFDHFVGSQLNASLSVFPNLKIFEVCGLIYHQTGPEFKLLLGPEFQGLDPESEAALLDMGRVLSGTEPGLKSLSNVKSSERRRLFATICEHYGLDEADLVARDVAKLVLPAEIKYADFKSPKAWGTIYTDLDGVPIWFKTRNSPLIPSLFTLWKYPRIVPMVTTHQYVIERLVGGSNLMLPGTLPPFSPGTKKGAVVAVDDYKHPNVAVAVGFCEMDLENVTDVVGSQGVAVELVHVYEDWLCGMVKGAKLPDKVDVEPQLVDESVSATSEQVAQLEIAEQPATPREQVALTPQDMDGLFLNATLYTLSQDSVETPIDASLFMSAHVLKNFPPMDSSLINIKKTSWKKTAKYLKAMEKEDLLKVKGKGDDLVVVALNKDNEQVKKFEPYRVKKTKTGSSKAAQSGEASSVTLNQMYKAHSSATNFLRAVDSVKDYYTQTEIKSLVGQYIQKQNLVDPKNPKSIVADEVLQRLLKTEKIERSKVVDVVIKQHFSPYYQIVRGDESTKPKKGLPPSIKVIEETKIGRKIVTRVVGVEEFLVDPDEISSVLKVKCSGSSTVTNNVQNPKVMEVTVQGPHFKTVQEVLVKQLGRLRHELVLVSVLLDDGLGVDPVLFDLRRHGRVREQAVCADLDFLETGSGEDGFLVSKLDEGPINNKRDPEPARPDQGLEHNVHERGDLEVGRVVHGQVVIVLDKGSELVGETGFVLEAEFWQNGSSEVVDGVEEREEPKWEDCKGDSWQNQQQGRRNQGVLDVIVGKQGFWVVHLQGACFVALVDDDTERFNHSHENQVVTESVCLPLGSEG
ncbi:hypothetical protein OGAPHI_001163 [Ogataea philodendri]|uniref:Uncharacterized protein n=1 Tax=Ogataea philodendri TaxID=1378263 RepID=A0A9P8PE81_9ASCO|nr:uncharacterized protein OGAPHI_001163 [Ogataea philodendri]KAH3670648.1 hypothetical protein OGAPHI_001163 [Ogataea philodendri]